MISASFSQLLKNVSGALRGGGQRELVVSDSLRPIEQKIQARVATGEIISLLNAAKVPLREQLRRYRDDSTASAALTLKLLNLLLSKHHFLQRSPSVGSRPFGLLIDPANGCNLACPGCVQSSRSKSLGLFDWNNGLLTASRFESLLARFGPYATQVMFCNYGEPLVNTGTPQLIAMAKAYFLQTALSTNLSLPRVDADAYVNSGLDFMYLAIDGASQPVYSQYRKNGDIGVVLRNVEKLVAAKHQLGRRTPILRWQYLAFEHNAGEIEKASELARDLGVDQFVVETPFDVSWDDPGIRPATVPPFQLEFTPDSGRILAENWSAASLPPAVAESIEREFADAWSARAADVELAASSSSAHTCHWLYKSLTMDANGRILPCCGAPKKGSDLVFGILGQGGPDHFDSDHYRQARRFFQDRAAYDAACAAGAPATYCASCEWDQERTEFGATEVAQYLRTASAGGMDPEAIAICSNW